MKRRFTEDSWRREPWFKSLVASLRACKNDTEMENFLRDIATLSELQALSERLEVARLIAKGLSYRQIAKETGASTTTVTRVAAFLENGQGGYRSILNAHRHHRLNADVKKADNAAHLHSHTDSPSASAHGATVDRSGERPVSPLQKYLDK